MPPGPALLRPADGRSLHGARAARGTSVGMDQREQELERFREAVDRKSEEAREAAESTGKHKKTADKWNQ